MQTNRHGDLNMRKFLAIIFIFFSVNLPSFSAIFQGGVAKDGIIGQHKIIDAETNAPISGAKVTIPQTNYQTYTDKNGNFTLGPDIDGQTVLSVDKAGYKPYSMTIGRETSSHPLIIGMEKSTPKDISIDKQMIHLGDNSYSELSANSGDFQVQSVGPYYSKDFELPSVRQGAKVDLIIGSIIGVDTLLAKKMGQNRVVSAYASPPEVYFNGNKIASIQLNGDGQRIRIPYNLIKQNGPNEVTIKTGRNMMQTAHVDYDDIEFANLSIETN